MDMEKSFASSLETNELDDQAMNETKGDWLSKFLPTGWMGSSTKIGQCRDGRGILGHFSTLVHRGIPWYSKQ
eukprot:scaffold35357_cov73-Cyclotella_meneghiniana.AAC.3